MPEAATVTDELHQLDRVADDHPLAWPSPRQRLRRRAGRHPGSCRARRHLPLRDPLRGPRPVLVSPAPPGRCPQGPRPLREHAGRAASRPDYYAPGRPRGVPHAGRLHDVRRRAHALRRWSAPRTPSWAASAILMLVNGEPDYELEVTERARSCGCTSRTCRTRAPSTSRSRGLATPGVRDGGSSGRTRSRGTGSARIKVVGTDVGRLRARGVGREHRAESRPSGTSCTCGSTSRASSTLVNRVQGIDHLAGAFFAGEGHAWGYGARCGVRARAPDRRSLRPFQPPSTRSAPTSTPRARSRSTASTSTIRDRPRAHVHPRGRTGPPVHRRPADALRFGVLPPGGVERHDVDDELERHLATRWSWIVRDPATGRREHGHRVATSRWETW